VGRRQDRERKTEFLFLVLVLVLALVGFLGRWDEGGWGMMNGSKWPDSIIHDHDHEHEKEEEEED